MEFPDGWGVLEKISSMGEVWIFSGITQYTNDVLLYNNIMYNNEHYWFIIKEEALNFSVSIKLFMKHKLVEVCF